jgi:hypothetical protein
VTVRDVNALIPEAEAALTAATVGLNLDAAAKTAKDCVDTGNVGEEFWKSQPNPGDEELKQALMSRQLANFGKNLGDIVRAKRNVRLNMRLNGEVRRSAARGNAVRFTNAPAPRTTSVGSR